jgi:hypothetical protein
MVIATLIEYHSRFKGELNSERLTLDMYNKDDAIVATGIALIPVYPPEV